MTIHLNGFSQCSPCPQCKGQWKHSSDHSVPGYRDLDYWIEYAKLCEAACFDAMFLADVHGTYDVYQGSREMGVRHGVQIPCNDPTVILPALAREVPHLGFATTYSTTYFAPYHTAKLFSTLDHATSGRIGWNVVTSYLRDAEANGLGKMLPHDERYDRADEYMDVVYKLWEASWEEGAIVFDKKNDYLIDPSKVHEINHHGKYFDVRGPHICEPSPQRTPVIYQAGSSDRGIEFAAKHGEALFVVFPNVEICRDYTDRIRAKAREYGRSSDHLKILTAYIPVVGKTEDDAREKYAQMRANASPEGALALFGGWTGIDLGEYNPDDQLEKIDSEGMRFLAQYFSSVDSTRDWTIREIGEYLSIGSVCPVAVGTASQIVDDMERWLESGGVDGFNVLPVHTPSSMADFVEFIAPELQRRGLLRSSYDTNTLREHYFGPGNSRLHADHVGRSYTFPQSLEKAEAV